MITISVLELKGQLRSLESGLKGPANHLLESVLGVSSPARFFSNVAIAGVESDGGYELFTAEGGDVVESMLSVGNADIVAPSGEVSISRHEDGEISIDCGFDFGVVFTRKQADELMIAMRVFVAANPP